MASRTPDASGSTEPTSSASAVDLDGQLVLISVTGDAEQWFVLRDGTLRRFYQASQCTPCSAVSPDGRYVAHPYDAEGSKFGSAVYDAAADETLELPVPDDLDGLGPGPFDPTTGRLFRVGWSDSDPAKGGYYTSNVDGTDLQPLFAPTEDQQGEVFGWSPDGRWLLVFREDPSRTAASHLGDLLLLSPDGSSVRKLTPEGASIQPIGFSRIPATFSQDGTMVAFAGYQTDDPVQTAVFVADTSGGPARQLTTWGPGTRSAVFSPTDDRLLFDRADGEGSALSVIEPDGTGERELWSTSRDGEGCCATWSPDGTRILFQRDHRPERSLWVMDLDGAVLGRVDVEPAFWAWYRWTPTP